MSRNRVAGDGVDVHLAALRCTAAGLVFNGRSGWSGLARHGESCRGRAPSCVSGLSMASPGRHQTGRWQADTVWKLVVLEDVVL